MTGLVHRVWTRSYGSLLIGERSRRQSPLLPRLEVRWVPRIEDLRWNAELGGMEARFLSLGSGLSVVQFSATTITRQYIISDLHLFLSVPCCALRPGPCGIRLAVQNFSAMVHPAY